jgi:hypothetical protein
MSRFTGKTFLDGGFNSFKVNGISLGDITGANKAAEAAKEGARLSKEATLESTEKQIDFSKWLWGEQKALSEPFVEMGRGAIPQYQEALAKPLTMEELYKEPGYQFGLTEGQRTVETSGAARGMQLSGQQVKAQQRFGTDYASTKYGEAFKRRQANLDNLYRMISGGQAAAAGQAQAGGQMGTQVLGAMGEAGRAEAGYASDIGQIGAAQATSGWNTIMDIGNLAASYYNPIAGGTKGFRYGG